MFQGRRRKERRPISLSGLFSVFFLGGGGGYGLVALPCGLVISVTH